jgi:hypothetical protein
VDLKWSYFLFVSFLIFLALIDKILIKLNQILNLNGSIYGKSRINISIDRFILIKI